MNRLEVENLKAGYGQTIILEDVSLQVAEGEIRAILGGSGSGKSTLMKNVIGLETPLAGKITILGRQVDWEREQLASDLMQRIGVLFQNSALLTSLTVSQNVALPLNVHRPELDSSILDEMVRIKLAQVHLEHAFHKFPGELSGGMKKRAGLARALITDPDLLFCDEPSAGLDPVSSRSLDELLLELRESLKLSIVIVTHELDSINTIADKLLFLAEKKVAYNGPLSEAKESGPQLVRDFLQRTPPAEGGTEERVAFTLED